MKLKLGKHWTTGETVVQMFNTTFLRHTGKLNEFKITLNDRLQALQDLLKEEEAIVEDNWKGIKKALTITFQEDPRKEEKKTAINNSRTRTDKIKAQAEYTEANKPVESRIKVDEQKYVEEVATTAEKAILAGKYSNPERPVKDNEGKTITEIQQQVNIWVEYFEKLLNRPAPLNPPCIEAAHTNLLIDVTPPTTEEIRIAGYQPNEEWKSNRT
ncbi:unnamed protein product [Schistosoma curassoni]|uniref:Uncharacterized protein n=1 Tax=Schistosoma curassoni TaxID=6186 RepID=A0A183KVV0_9TREM|nr:unnamed protein product [Schistosoma curassoni]